MKDRIHRSIIDSAERLFNRFGTGKTAVSDIAEMAEVSRATIFNNFGSKEGLIEAVLKKKADDFRQYCRNMSGSGESSIRQIKMILLERIRILQTLNFITDRSLKLKSRHLDIFFGELNDVFISWVTRILDEGSDEISEKRSAVNTIFFMLKGIEQGLFERLDRIELSGIEKDMDFFLRQLLSGGRENGNR